MVQAARGVRLCGIVRTLTVPPLDAPGVALGCAPARGAQASCPGEVPAA